MLSSVGGAYMPRKGVRSDCKHSHLKFSRGSLCVPLPISFHFVRIT